MKMKTNIYRIFTVLSKFVEPMNDFNYSKYPYDIEF